jgi:hypothetical protein
MDESHFATARRSATPLNGPPMPEQISATQRRDSRGGGGAPWVLGTVVAFVTAWLLSGAFCFLSAHVGLRLPSFTCGRSFGVAFLIFFTGFWPMCVFLWPLLFRKSQ